MTAAEMAEHQDTVHLNTICKLLSLRDQAYQLTAVKDVTIDGRVALGFQVRRQGRPDVRLYFDKTIGLLPRRAQGVEGETLGTLRADARQALQLFDEAHERIGKRGHQENRTIGEGRSY